MIYFKNKEKFFLFYFREAYRQNFCFAFRQVYLKIRLLCVSETKLSLNLWTLFIINNFYDYTYIFIFGLVAWQRIK